MQDIPALGDDSVPISVYLEGNSTPFEVTIKRAFGPMMVGEEGPVPEFDPGIEIAESIIPDRLAFT